MRDDRVFAGDRTEKGAALRAAGKDPRAAYEEDQRWFVGLIHCLENDFGFEVVRERVFENAMLRAERRDFDAAVIDLSWSGDGDLPPGKRSNVGFQIIDLLKPRETGMPVIAFSQNFAEHRELMLQVIQRGALAMQKTYGSIDYLTLGSAILYLTGYRPRPAADASAAVAAKTTTAAKGWATGSTLWDVLREVPRPYLLAALPAALLLLLAHAHLGTAPGEPVRLFGVELYDRGQ